MKIDPKDIRIDHFYLGPGKGSSLKAIHLPTGVSVVEDVPTSSTGPSAAIRARLLSALKVKIEESDSSKKSSGRVLDVTHLPIQS
jgi:hypothetical protein